jgi:hypothetical protein
MAPSRMFRNRKPTPEQLAEAAKPMTRLDERREELRARFTEMQWDLGGAAYEMAARDYFRLDVLAGMAARLQVVDAELAEIERMSRLESAGAGGSCAGCGALHARGAIYCWRCGRNLFEVPARPALIAAQPGAGLEQQVVAPTAPEGSADPASVPPHSRETPPSVVPGAAAPASPETAPLLREEGPGGPLESVAGPALTGEPAAPAGMTDPRAPFVRPWAGASDSEPAAAPGSVTVPPFEGAVEVPTYERPVQPPEEPGSDIGGR